MRKGFNSRLREEATDGLAKMDALLNVSTHASVRRRPSKKKAPTTPAWFQLTPP